MNSKQLIKVIELGASNFILGSAKGNLFLEALRNQVYHSTKIVEFSFEGIVGVDACFVRNGIAGFAKMHSGEIGVMISNVENENVLDNLCYGFGAKDMPLLVKNKDGSGSCYSTVSTTQLQYLSYVYKQKETSTQQIAKSLNKSAPNVSAALKKLFKQGYFLAQKDKAETGGIEYIYAPFFMCVDLKFHN